MHSSSDEQLLINPHIQSSLSGGIFNDFIYLKDEIILNIELPKDPRIFPTLHLYMKEKLIQN